MKNPWNENKARNATPIVGTLARFGGETPPTPPLLKIEAAAVVTPQCEIAYPGGTMGEVLYNSQV